MFGQHSSWNVGEKIWEKYRNIFQGDFFFHAARWKLAHVATVFATYKTVVKAVFKMFLKSHEPQSH